MKVYQLIKKLQKLPSDATVLLSSDEEGNSFSELCEVTNAPDKYYDKRNRCIENKDEVKDLSSSKDNIDNIIILYP